VLLPELLSEAWEQVFDGDEWFTYGWRGGADCMCIQEIVRVNQYPALASCFRQLND
jgi:hypothetical protein